ncbi:unnamed protein product [Gordionus sp. m RMFG-2023]
MESSFECTLLNLIYSNVMLPKSELLYPYRKHLTKIHSAQRRYILHERKGLDSTGVIFQYYNRVPYYPYYDWSLKRVKSAPNYQIPISSWLGIKNKMASDLESSHDTNTNNDKNLSLAYKIKLRGRDIDEYDSVNYIMNKLEEKTSADNNMKIIKTRKPWNGLFQNDIVLTQLTAFHAIQNNVITKTISRVYPTWKNNLPIKYQISELDDETVTDSIEKAIKMWENETCIRFTKVEQGSEDYLNFYSGAGCWSYIGKTGGEQLISVSSKCPEAGEIAHELGHALGLWHEQSRPDRDFYVEVLYENVEQGYSKDFAKSPKINTKPNPVPYDLSSLMHYDPLTLSSNGLPTLKTINPRHQPAMGNREYITFSDAKTINNEYCSETCGFVYRASKCYRQGYPDPNNCTRCKCPDGFGGLYCEKIIKEDDECSKEVLNKRYGLIKVWDTGNITLPKACNWLIQARPCQTILFELLELKIGGYAKDNIRCLNWIEIRGAEDLSLIGERVCGYKLPSDQLFRSHGSEMLIMYRISINAKLNDTDSFIKGFIGRYKIGN